MSAKPFPTQEWLIDFILSNARQFYSSKGDPLYVNDLTSILLLFLGETGERSTTTPSSQKQWGSLFPSFGVLGILGVLGGLCFQDTPRLHALASIICIKYMQKV